MHFWQPCQKIFAKSRGLFCSKSDENFGNIIFSKKKLIFLKKLLWKRRMQFWQPCWTFFAKSPKTFCSKSHNDNKIQKKFKKMFFLKLFLWTRRLQFWDLCWIIFITSPKIFCSKSESDQSVFFFKKNLFPRNNALDTWNEVLTTLSKIFTRIKKFLFKFQNWFIKIYLFQKSFSSKCSSGHEECSLENPTENLIAKFAQTFFANSKNDAKNQMFFKTNS